MKPKRKTSQARLEQIARRLAANAIRQEDVPTCPGVKGLRNASGAREDVVCGQPADPAIRGYDGIFRCIVCHRVHGELVHLESGQSAPNAGEAADKNALPVGKGITPDRARRMALLEQFDRRGDSTLFDAHGRPVEALTAERAARRSEGSDAQEASEAESAEQRRRAILNKYGAKRRGAGE